MLRLLSRGENVTIGSCGTGRADISTVGSGPNPATFKVHDITPFDTQEMYYAEINTQEYPDIVNCGLTALSYPGGKGKLLRTQM